MKPDDLADDVVDPVLERLVASLPADRALAGDDDLLARSVEGALARRAAPSPNSSRAPASGVRPWAALAAAGAVIVGVSAAVIHSQRGETRVPAPLAASNVEAPRVDEPVNTRVESEPVATPTAPEVPSIDVRSLPAAPRLPARAPASDVAEKRALERSAAEIFAAANDARRRRDPAAVELYRELQSTYPSSAEAETSFVTLGRLELDRGHPSVALAQFDRYLAAKAGELREDALAGRAGALEALGRTSDERRAWEALLAEFPQTLVATHARARLSSEPRGQGP